MKTLKEFREINKSNIDEGVGIDMIKNFIPKKLLHTWKKLKNKERYKVAIKYFYRLKKDPRGLTYDRRLVVAAHIAGVPPREFKKVLEKETRYENIYTQRYIKPSKKLTGKVLEDGRPETVRAYKNMTPGEPNEETSVQEKAPPDGDIENWIDKNKERFISQYGEDDYAPYLYGRAWKMYNKKHDINN